MALSCRRFVNGCFACQGTFSLDKDRVAARLNCFVFGCGGFPSISILAHLGYALSSPQFWGFQVPTFHRLDRILQACWGFPSMR